MIRPCYHQVLLCVLLLLSGACASGQPVRLLRSLVHPVTSIDPADEDFSDLEFLKTSLHDKRIVLLGEGTHHDGSALQARNRMIRFLHREMGFGVLLLESSFFGIDRMARDVAEGKADWARGLGLANLGSMLRTGGAGIYAHDEELATYLERAWAGERPLYLGGIDPAGIHVYDNAWVDDLEGYLRTLLPDFKRSAAYRDFETLSLKGVFYQNDDAAKNRLNRAIEKDLDLDALRRAGQALRELILQRMPTLPAPQSRRGQFFARAIVNHLAYWEWKQQQITAGPFEHSFDEHALRDRYMAENVRWFLEQYFPHQKIIIAASAYHIGRNFQQIEPRPSRIGPASIPLGQLLTEDYRDSLYAITFLHHRGRRGIQLYPNDPPEEKLEPRAKRGLETQLSKVPYPYAFVDLSDPAVRQQLGKTTINLFFENTTAQWSNHFDGFFFIRELEPVRVQWRRAWMKKRPPYYPRETWYRR